jgi:hypothetical protein
MNIHSSDKVLKTEVVVMGIRGIVQNNSLFNHSFPIGSGNTPYSMGPRLNNVYTIIGDITVKVSIDGFGIFTELIWNEKKLINFKGYPSISKVDKLDEIYFDVENPNYNLPLKNEKRYTLCDISFRYFLDEQDVHYDWNANDEFNWSE